MKNRPAPAAATIQLDGSSPEKQVSLDIAKRGLMIAPVIVAICAALWGGDGAVSSVYGLALIVVNFLLSAGLMAYAARISLAVLMGMVLFGYLIRIGLIFLAVFLVKDAAWISRPALGLTIIVTHLGLLLWELRYVSASLAFPGLKPAPKSVSLKSPARPSTSPSS